MNDIVDMAARYLARRDEPDWTVEDEAELEAWLAASFRHKAAYWRLERGWQELDRLRSLGPAASETCLPPRYGGTPSAMRAAAALAAVVTGLFFFPVGSPPVEYTRYITGTGERQLVTLSDGTRIELNSSTSIRTSFSKSARNIWLDRGEVYTEVRHDRSRPFIVHVSDSSVTALGTKFDVWRKPGRIVVAVLEGKVQLNAMLDSRPSGGTVLAEGDVAIARDNAVTISSMGLEKVRENLSWRDGIIVFDETPLATAVATFNRYNKEQLVIDDPTVGALRIGGSFRTTNVDSFVSLLSEAYGLKITQTGNLIKISGT